MPTNATATPAHSMNGGAGIVSGSSGGTGGSIGGHVPVPGGSPGGTDETTTPSIAPPTDDDGGELDPREANVIAVEATLLYDGRYMFEVTLSHDDAGENGFADWWQVETREGKLLGRRSFFRSHDGRESFSSLKRIAVPTDAHCVVVRGHDETHGYGGQAMVISLNSGATTAVRQGSSKASMRSVACPGEE